MTQVASTGDFWMPAGLLSADQICSPIQLVFDNEWMGSLKRFLNDFEVSDESVGIDAVLDAGPGASSLTNPIRPAICAKRSGLQTSGSAP